MLLAAHQPQYLAYTGYFAKIDRADKFVLLDTVQFKKNEWQNRNRIKGPNGVQFITVPVSFNFGDTIKNVTIPEKEKWRKKHLMTVKTCYSKAPFFNEFYSWFEESLSQEWVRLGDLNNHTVTGLMKLLGISTEVFIASELPEMPEHPDRRLIGLCKYLGCDTYLAGEGGGDYMDLNIWKDSGINVVFQRFREPVRKQLFGDFEPNLSAADLYMNEGNNSLDLLRRGSEIMRAQD
ncbi:WbqC family protein [bacterium]|nr:WbqC family protein [bacterium]